MIQNRFLDGGLLETLGSYTAVSSYMHTFGQRVARKGVESLGLGRQELSGKSFLWPQYMGVAIN